MGTLYDQMNLAAQPQFQSRVAAAAVHAAISKLTAGVNDVQTISVTGTPTGGNFTLASLPGSIISIQTATLTSAATTCTGLTSTVGLFVGMSVVGTNVAAGCTITAIPSGTAVTLSANSSGTGAQSLTFSGTPVASIPFNATAGDVQAILQNLNNIGNGNVSCSGGPLPGTPVIVTYQGALGNLPLRLMTLGTNAMTGGSSPVPSFAHTTLGISITASDKVLVSKVLNNPTGYGQLMAMGVADNSTVQTDFPGPNYQLNVSESTASNDIQFQMNSIFSLYI